METRVLEEEIKQTHKILQENNVLLRKIIKQNQLIFEITQKNIGYYSPHWLWGESGEVKRLRQELNNLYEEVMK